jgi:hypothetical protein
MVYKEQGGKAPHNLHLGTRQRSRVSFKLQQHYIKKQRLQYLYSRRNGLHIAAKGKNCVPARN